MAEQGAKERPRAEIRSERSNFAAGAHRRKNLHQVAVSALNGCRLPVSSVPGLRAQGGPVFLLA